MSTIEETRFVPRRLAATISAALIENGLAALDDEGDDGLADGVRRLVVERERLDAETAAARAELARLDVEIAERDARLAELEPAAVDRTLAQAYDQGRLTHARSESGARVADEREAFLREIARDHGIDRMAAFLNRLPVLPVRRHYGA